MTQVISRNPVQEQAWRDRVLPPVERLDGDIVSVPVPIPDNPLRYTLSYLVPGDSGLVVVDPGWDSDEGWRALLAGLTAAGATGADVLGIVATHVHPDHHGMSGRLHAVSGAWVAMHPAEAATLPRRAADGRPRPPGLADAASWLGAVCGAPDDAVAEIMTGFRAPDAATEDGAGGRRRDDDMPPGFATMVDPDVLLDDGDLVPLPGRDLRALWTPGHTPGHLCLVDRTAGAVLTGDHVLPGITPNISAYPGSAPSMLAQFLASLRAVAVHDDLDVFPAHQYRFRGLAARVDELVEHHEQRCSEILDVVAALGGPTLWQLAERLHWSRPWDRIGRMRMAALGETAAHVEYLTERGAVVWDRGTGGPAGPPWRVRVAAALPVD